MTKIYNAIILAIFFVLAQSAMAQTTAFNFQGRLNDGSSPANGHYDLQFKLYDAISGGNQVGSTISKTNTTLVNGVFSTQLDFGANAFDGSNRFIEIGLRQTAAGGNPPNAFVILGPRQQILSVPYSIRSSRATLADDASNSQNLGGIAPNGFILNRTFPQTADFNVSGSGTVGGRLSVGGDANLSGNVGIGGNATTNKLSVTGSTLINGDTLFNGNILSTMTRLSITNCQSDRTSRNRLTVMVCRKRCSKFPRPARFSNATTA